MLSKVNKDNPIFVSFLLYFDPPVYQFSKSLYPPVYYEPESTIFDPALCEKRETVDTASAPGISERGELTAPDDPANFNKSLYTYSYKKSV